MVSTDQPSSWSELVLERCQNRRQESICCREDISRIIEAVIDAMGREGYSGQDSFGVRLALEEAIVNSIKHGHKGDVTKPVQVQYSVTPQYVLIAVQDQGPGFRPDQVPDPTAPANLERPGGRGLFLMRRYMTWTRFNDRGNRVTFCKHRVLPSPEQDSQGAAESR